MMYKVAGLHNFTIRAVTGKEQHKQQRCCYISLQSLGKMNIPTDYSKVFIFLLAPRFDIWKAIVEMCLKNTP